MIKRIEILLGYFFLTTPPFCDGTKNVDFVGFLALGFLSEYFLYRNTFYLSCLPQQSFVSSVFLAEIPTCVF